MDNNQNNSEIPVFDIDNDMDRSNIYKVIVEKWEQLANLNVFRYKLNTEKHKYLPGRYKFFALLNEERTTLRRLPEQFSTITPNFNENQFNFTNCSKQEFLLKIIDQDIENTILINNSPIAKYHSLICPNIDQKLPQILTKNIIKSMITLMECLKNTNFRIGFNSPCALASVNHLHFHLLNIKEELFIENAQIIPVVKNLYQLDENYEIKSYCFPIFPNIDNKNEIIDDIFMLIEFFYQHNIPHNLFITYGISPTTTMSPDSPDNIIKIFIFPRNILCGIKVFSTFNIAFCELSGYVPIGNEEIYESLTEHDVLEKISNDVGDISHEIKIKILKLFS